MKSKTIFFLLFLGYLGVGYVPNLIAVDKMATQFFYLGILNILGLFCLAYFKKGLFFINKYSFITFFGLILWSISSYFYAFNKGEVFIYSNKIFIFLTSFLVIYSLLREIELNKTKFIFLIILLLIFEILWINALFILRFNISEGRDMGLRAFTGNINITGIALLFKIPFLVFGINEFKGVLKKALIILLPISIFTVLLMGSRLSNLILGFLIFGFIIYNIISKGKIVSAKTIIIYVCSVTFSVLSNYLIFEESSINVIERSTGSLINNHSTEQRLRFYKQAINYFFENPIFGTGAGNWKIQSLISDREFLSEYIVPYQVHNDYLQIAAELGIIGFFLKYSFYFIILYLLVKNYKKLLKGEKMIFFLVIPFIIFLLDSAINFPNARPIMIIFTFIFLCKLFLKIESNGFFKSYKIKTSIFYLILIISLPSTYFSFVIYKSFVNQNHLIVGMLQDSYYLTEDEVYEIDSTIPSIGATTVPMEIYKANYLFNKGIYSDTLFDMVDEGAVKNPHLFTQHAVKSVMYIRIKKDLDSAKHYAEKAFHGISDNSVHYNLYTDLLAVSKDSVGLQEAYNSLKKPTRENFTEKYLKHMNSIRSNFDKKDSLLIDELYNNKRISNLGDALNIINKIGKENVFKGFNFATDAELNFKNKKYKIAAELYEKAIEFNPEEIAYYDNAANSYMKLGDNQKAIKLLLKAINRFETTGKTEYLLAILFYDEGDNEKGCKYILEAKAKEFDFPRGIEMLFCKYEYY